MPFGQNSELKIKPCCIVGSTITAKTKSCDHSITAKEKGTSSSSRAGPKTAPAAVKKNIANSPETDDESEDTVTSPAARNTTASNAAASVKDKVSKSSDRPNSAVRSRRRP